jgi:hypothetical protein
MSEQSVTKKKNHVTKTVIQQLNKLECLAFHQALRHKHTSPNVWSIGDKEKYIFFNSNDTKAKKLECFSLPQATQSCKGQAHEPKCVECW